MNKEVIQRKDHMKELHLGYWEEVVGCFGGVTSDDFFIHIKIGDWVLVHPKESKEACTLVKWLRGVPIGQKVGFLRAGDAIKARRI